MALWLNCDFFRRPDFNLLMYKLSDFYALDTDSASIGMMPSQPQSEWHLRPIVIEVFRVNLSLNFILRFNLSCSCEMSSFSSAYQLDIQVTCYKLIAKLGRDENT